MADRRLEEIRTSDDHDSTVNVELIEWLKTTGVNYLLVILLIVIAFRGYLWWQEQRQGKIDTAWADFAGTDTPAALESLADRSAGIGSISEMALLEAARRYHTDILRDQTLELIPETPSIGDPASIEDGAEESAPAVGRMTDQERAETLAKMERLYARVHELTAPQAGKTNWRILLRLQATFGLAAVAEMREDWDAAAQWYAQVEEEAGSEYSALGAVARRWRENPIKTRPVFVPKAEIDERLFKPIPASPDAEGGVDAPVTPTDPDEGLETPDENSAESDGSVPETDKPSSGDGG